ncbi:5-formyltetrahydrofolate cyclo-ligase [Bacillus mesophilus]|uniref:5-formyltetrahydrofolate cyclo-ligase n=1 Tax=Bacillus mesophilus TaxID=1808955 RepID=A0A6M0Q5I0_9BACI|nr:5-formyltetrahydrofolate cyclo-ligase [Bacillus mesophilus]MBM7660842.1 5-formyltetrahydrofolate cyclo-ligase [Bacillus mesophilus]NEY71611.1 5-formyltetrahydrofolate cyclo-ligase [Bacillus mesophilus]
MTKTKKELRLQVKERLESLSTYEFQQNCEKVAYQLYNTNVWMKSKTIGITISRGREIETRQIIERAWKEGKKVAVPKCYSEQHKMEFYFITSFEQLEVVFFGLQEPVLALTEHAPANDLELLIVPGICYTEKGYRIGYGGGYYDRYLEHYQQDTVSLLLECQLVPEIPVYSYDLPIQKLISEERIISCAK